MEHVHQTSMELGHIREDSDTEHNRQSSVELGPGENGMEPGPHGGMGMRLNSGGMGWGHDRMGMGTEGMELGSEGMGMGLGSEGMGMVESDQMEQRRSPRDSLLDVSHHPSYCNHQWYTSIAPSTHACSRCRGDPCCIISPPTDPNRPPTAGPPAASGVPPPPPHPPQLTPHTSPLTVRELRHTTRPHEVDIILYFCFSPADPLLEEEEEEEGGEGGGEEGGEVFHYDAANRMIASATPIHTAEVPIYRYMSTLYCIGHRMSCMLITCLFVCLIICCLLVCWFICLFVYLYRRG